MLCKSCLTFQHHTDDAAIRRTGTLLVPVYDTLAKGLYIEPTVSLASTGLEQTLPYGVILSTFMPS
jgi:hypothetical protein